MRRVRPSIVDLTKKQTAAAAAAVAVSLAVLGWWVVQHSKGDGAAAGSVTVAQGPTASPFATLPAGAQLPAEPAAATASQPALAQPGIALSAEELAALKEAVKDQPNAAAEFERLKHYAMFQKRFERWQMLKQGPLTDERRGLAQQMLNEVPEHLQRREMMAGEALMLNIALLEDVEPDQARREARIAQYKAYLEAQANQPDEAESIQRAEDERKLNEYNRRAKVVQDQYLRLPEAQRDPKAYADQLDAIRKEVYDGR